MNKGGWVYILTNKHHTVLSPVLLPTLLRGCMIIEANGTLFHSLPGMMLQSLFITTLFQTIEEAIAEEKKLKGGSRSAEVKLFESATPT